MTTPLYGTPEWIAETRAAADGHPHFRYDASKRVVERAVELGSTHVRCSPDIVHMLLEGHEGLYQHGIHAICDPALPPNSMVSDGALGS